MKNLLKTLPVAALLSCALFSQQAQAVPITGDIRFQVDAQASGTSGAGSTTITFPSSGIVTYVDGDYTGVPTGGPLPPVTFNSITFSGTGAGAVLSADVSPQWTFVWLGTTYSFNLTDLDTAEVTLFGSLSILVMSGTGVANITGFDPTVATWSLSGTDGTGFTFKAAAVSTTADGAGVPDGGLTVALLGFALVGVEGLRRKLKK